MATTIRMLLCTSTLSRCPTSVPARCVLVLSHATAERAGPWLASVRLLTRPCASCRVSPRSFSTSRGKHGDHAIDLVLGREQPQAEAQRVLRPMRGEAHRPQHVRRLERAGRAGRPGRDGDALEIERDQQALGLDAIEADVGRVRHPRVARPLTTVPGHALRGCRLSSRSRSAPTRAASAASLATASAPPRPGRRAPARSRCRRGGSARACRRSGSAASACRASPRARRRPSGR